MPIVSPAPIHGFRGLNERRLLGADPRETSSLDNVNVRNGVVLGRRGMSKYDSISAAASATIIGLTSFYDNTSGASALGRMLPAKFEKWNSGTHAWDDKTGVALTGVATTRPQFTMINKLGLLAFTNEGKDRPRKWDGSTNTVVLAGTPPYAKAIGYYVGFLLLGNISSNGTTFAPLDLILSDDPDGTWEECADVGIFVTTLTVNESPGEILAILATSQDCFIYKSDAIVRLRFVGGVTRFNKERLRFPLGILAPLSLQGLGEFGQIFLATDRNLYINNNEQVIPLPPAVQKSLQETLPAAIAPFVRSMVDPATETYILGYQRTGTTYLDALLEYNYRTGEFSRKKYPVEFNAMTSFKPSATTAFQRVASSATLVYQLESGINDDGTAISRYFDLDWTDFGQPGNKWVQGFELSFTKAAGISARISVGVDRQDKLQFQRLYSLKARNVNETEVRVQYNLPAPLFGTYFRLRIEFIHATDTQAQLETVTPKFIPVHAAAEDTPKITSNAAKGLV